MKTAILLLTTLVLTAGGLASAQDSITLKDGRVVSGDIIGDDGRQITVRLADGAEMKEPYGNLGAPTLYLLAARKAARDDGPAQIKVAELASAAGQYSDAVTHYGMAERADPGQKDAIEAKLAKLRAAASQAQLTQAKWELSNGRHAQGEHRLSTSMHDFPDEPAAAGAKILLDGLHADQQRALAAKHSADTLAKLDPAQKALAESRQKVKDGLGNAKNQSVCIDDFKAAVREGERGLDEVKQTRQRDASTADAAADLKSQLVSAVVNADIQLATAYQQRTSYNDAAAAVADGLSVDPTNAQLLAMQQSIAGNVAENASGYGWYGAYGAGGNFRERGVRPEGRR